MGSLTDAIGVAFQVAWVGSTRLVVAPLVASAPILACDANRPAAAPSEGVEPTVQVVARSVVLGSIVELDLRLPADVPLTSSTVGPNTTNHLVEASGWTDQVAQASHVVVGKASPWLLERRNSIRLQQKVRSEPSLAGFRSHERSLRKFLPRSASVQRCTVAPRSRGDAEIKDPQPAPLRQPVQNDGGGGAARGRSP